MTVLNPETLRTLILLGRFAFDTIERYSNGEMTDEEVAEAYAALQPRLAESNRLWEQAGGA